jgi:hypothetical protein
MLVIRDRQKAAENLLLQCRIERAAKRMAAVGAIMMVVITIAAVVSIFRPNRFYG